MKSRIQIAGNKFGVRDGTIWEGDLPFIAMLPGMKVVVRGDGEVDDFTFKQLCLEVSKAEPSETVQVLYVTVNRPRPR